MDVIVDMETPKPPPPPPPAQAQGLRPNPVVERKLGELEACLADAMSSRPRRGDVDGSLFTEIQARTDFLKTLIGAEVECHGGAVPDHLAEAKARLAVLKGAFDQWAAPPEEEEEAAGGAATGSECSCTESCFGVEVAGCQDATPDGDAEREAVEVAPLDAAAFNAERVHGHKPAPAPAPAAATRGATRCRGWRRGAACCGAAGVALAVGLAIEFASVAHQNVYVVPT
uniref:DUF7610 domain-containing protein n=1 Tax=Leersia perrieri TaxID=77586 RepID=A0A0D9W800_9ORYZ